MEKKTLKLVTQVSDIDIIENEGESAYMAEVSDDERSSIDSYIFGKHFRSTPDFLEEAELPSFSQQEKSRGPANTDQGPLKAETASIKRSLDAPVDSRRVRSSGTSHRRRTVEEFLCNNLQEDTDESKIAEDIVISAVPENTTILETNTNPTHKSSKDSTVGSALHKELKHLMDIEMQHMMGIVELIQNKQAVIAALGRHVEDEIFESVKEIHSAQGWVVSLLDKLCKSSATDLDDVISKLCDRQITLLKYAQIVTPRLKSMPSKLQSKSISVSRQQLNDLLQGPTTWISQTIENVKRIKKLVLPGDPNYDILADAEDALFESANEFDLTPSKAVKEPVKHSLLVELLNPPNGERKLRTIFLFDNALVCARRRVITWSKHFKQEEADSLLYDSEGGSGVGRTKDQATLLMSTKSISRYDIKWFMPLDQLDSLDCDGIAFDEENLRERLNTITMLKEKITNAQRELQIETKKLDKESKRTKLKIPKIHRLRSYLHGLQAELVIQSPRLPLFIGASDGQGYCLLMSSEKERLAWKTAIAQEKTNLMSAGKPHAPPPPPGVVPKRNITLRTLANNFRDGQKNSVSSRSGIEIDLLKDPDSLRGELSYMINHCKSVGPLNRLGKTIISGSALSGILEVCIHRIDGLGDIAPYYVAIEVDFFGQFELVAKTKCVSETANPRWNQAFMIELDISQSINFTVFRQSSVVAQLELPLDEDQISQGNTSYSLQTIEMVPRTVKLYLSMSFTEKTHSRTMPKEQSSIFGQPLEVVLQRDQANLEGLRKLADGNRRKKTTEVGGAGGGGGVIRIPVLITACAEEIERRGLQEEGIYRTCGTTTAVNYLHGLFDKDASLAIKQMGDYDINVISSLLKLYFRSLPESLIPTSTFVELIAATAITDKSAKLAAFRKALDKMPPVNLDTLKYLLEHLSRVCKFESANKMNAGNLSVIWAMTLFNADSVSPIPAAAAQLNSTSNPESAKTPPLAVQSATFNSIIQTTVLQEIFKAFIEGKIDLSSSKPNAN